tara:strand:- start:2382 stop:2744 length:363 start_codon:yes stop_codon:yes gene_type:complete
MKLLGDQFLRKRRTEPRLIAQALGNTSHGILVTPTINNVKIVTPIGREPIQDIRFSDGSYSSYGIDLNPFGFAYRADSKREFAIDALTVALELATLGTGAGSVLGRGVRVAKRGFELYND